MDEKDLKTIQDFGRQWQIFTDNDGYYASTDCLQDILHGLMNVSEVKNKYIADIGSGTGRIVNMLLDAGASSVLAIEPSEAFNVLIESTKDRSDLVEALKVPGNQIPANRNLDLVVSIGVLHHILEPAPVVKAAFNSIRPSGRMLVWLYGKEGNRLYLSLIKPFRIISKRLPHRVLHKCCIVLNWFLSIYIMLCRFLSMPMKKYMLNHLMKLDNEQRILTIYDQLNPAYAKYYSKNEAISLLSDSGFKNIQIQHRHGYSWTVLGTKPD